MQFTVRDAIQEGIKEAMIEDKSVFVIGEEVAEYQGAYKVTQGLLQEFGSKRVVDTPITEHGFCGLAVGAAMSGLKPVVEFMTMNFSYQAIDQIVNSAAKTLYMSGGKVNCPIVIRGPNGAAIGVAAQHSQCFASTYMHVPGIKVVSPFTASDHKALIKEAIADPNPVVFLENEILYSHSHDKVLSNAKIGSANIIKSGRDITIVTFSISVYKALEAAKVLMSENIDVEIVDLRTLSPLDKETIFHSVMKTNRVLVLEEGWKVCGVASEISAIITEEIFDYLDAPVKRLSGLDIPLPYASNLEKYSIPQIEDIVHSVKSILNNCSA